MKKVPTFTTSGYISDPNKAISELMAHYFVNKRSQSDLQHINNIAQDVAESPQDPTTLAALVTNSLSAIYRSYFNEYVDVQVTPDLVDDEGRSVWRLQVSVTVVDNGNTYTLSEAYEQYSGGFKKLAEG